MSRRQFYRYIYTGLALSTVMLGLSATKVTALPTSNNAIRISPALSNIQLSASETSVTIPAVVTNLTSLPLSVKLSARDFSASAAQAGTIQFYGTSYRPSSNPHGLQSNVGFTLSSVIVAPKSSRKINIHLNNLTSLAAGGHYGAILFSPERSLSNGSKTRISINSAAASLIFLTTASGGTQSIRLLPFSVSRIRFSLPLTNYIAFKNTGNTQTAPQGQLSLYGPRGALAGTSVLNPGSGLVLPDTSRPYTVALPLAHTKLAWPGIYRLQLQYRDGLQTRLATTNLSFVYINLWLVVPMLGICGAVIYLLKHYNPALLTITGRCFGWLVRLIKRPPPPPPPPPKPKKRPRLIQG